MKPFSNNLMIQNPSLPSLEKTIADHVARNAGQSGFRVMTTGEDSLRARLSLITAAQKSIDLQYYAINDDVTSNLLIEAIMQAADRGVKVRFLIDDISVGKVQRCLVALDGTDNIKVKIFNPFSRSNQFILSRIVAFFSHFKRNTKRMHNKMLIADGQAGIMGGRNLGDEYFDAHADLSFKDIDMLSIGPITEKMVESFDKYWNNENARKVSELYKPNRDKEFLQKFREKLRESREEALKKSKKENDNLPAFDDYIRLSGEKFVWSGAEFYADEPAKINNRDFESEGGPLQTVFALGEKAEKEFLIISPYFVPGEDGLAWLQSLRNRGIKIRIITNSLASTDVVAVHTGYNSYRKAILESGIELFEMKPLNNGRTKQRLIGSRAPSHASLHAKVYIADKKTAIVGSLNFDPRSAQLNTEVALLVHSETIAKQLSDLYENVILPKSSYRLALEHGKVAWHSEEKGRKKVYYIEPDASPWRRLQAFLIDFLPVEKQL